MAEARRTIEQLARSLKVPTSDVMAAARSTLGLPAGSARNAKYLLTPHECQQIEKVLKPVPAAPADGDETGPGDEDRPLDPAPPLPTRQDPPARGSGLDFGPLGHRLWLHPDVEESLDGHTHLRKRLGIIMQQLAAHGRTSVTKGCSDDANRGWIRSPLGGNQGLQYYLWWSPQGSQPAKTLDLQAGDILVRAARHHDDHAPLKVGAQDDYLLLDQHTLEDDAFVASPWTPEQLSFVESSDPVRLLLGRPGSGKTSALWKAVEARFGQRVLYLTWSRGLAQCADERFRSFAPTSVQVDVRDFVTFLGVIRGADVPRTTLSASRATFRQAVSKLQPHLLGPWAGRESALFAEVRAYLLGRAVPGSEDATRVAGLLRLGDTAYRAERERDIGRAAADALLRIFEALAPEMLVEAFSELVAAGEAASLLGQGNVPTDLGFVDRIVIDEAQDLTLLETSVVVELCCALAKTSGYAPWLLLAADDGQTVRPSGFEWAAVNGLLSRRVATPRRFQLEENLRCPQGIAEVIERASTRYASLEKRERPTKQGRVPGGQHMNAHLIHVDAATPADAIGLLEMMDVQDGVVVVAPESDVPAWVPEGLRDVVLTPADAKGLEYQAVCVLDAGRLLGRLDGSARSSELTELEKHERRTTIDQLRVALSRATETLVIVDVGSSPDEQGKSRELLGACTPFDPADLAEHFSSDARVEERVRARMEDARALLDERPTRAWKCATQAVRLLGRADLPNGVSDVPLRVEAFRTLLHVAARLTVDGVPKEMKAEEVVEAAREALGSLESPREAEVFEALQKWRNAGSRNPQVERDGLALELLVAALGLDRDAEWLWSALSTPLQELRGAIRRCATAAGSARAFAGDVEGWLKLTRIVDMEIEAEARDLRGQAVDTLLRARDWSGAEAVLARIEPVDFLRTGMLREGQGRNAEAAESFERAGATQEALRVWRDLGQWRRAVRIAAPGSLEHDDLTWLSTFHELLRNRPSGHAKRLTPGELQGLQGAVDRALPRSKRKPAEALPGEESPL